MLWQAVLKTIMRQQIFVEIKSLMLPLCSSQNVGFYTPPGKFDIFLWSPITFLLSSNILAQMAVLFLVLTSTFYQNKHDKYEKINGA